MISDARLPTSNQTIAPQCQALRYTGCEEWSSDESHRRPVLARLLEVTNKGDTVVVVSIDRLAGSLAHLSEVIDKREAKGAFLLSLQDSIDTASSHGKCARRMLSAAGWLDGPHILKRTKTNLVSMPRKNKSAGDTSLPVQDRTVMRKVRIARCERYMKRLNENAEDWVPHVQRLRPQMAWKDVLQNINSAMPTEKHWTQNRLLRAVKAYVHHGYLPKDVLGLIPQEERDNRLAAIVASIKDAEPNISLGAICDRLESIREHTPRGQLRWQPALVTILLERAEKLGLLT